MKSIKPLICEIATEINKDSISRIFQVVNKSMGNKSSRKHESEEEEEERESSSPQVRKKGPLLIKDEEGNVRIKIRDQSEMTRLPLTVVVMDVAVLKEASSKSVLWLLRSDGVSPVLYAREDMNQGVAKAKAETLGMKDIVVADCSRKIVSDYFNSQDDAPNMFVGVRRAMGDIVRSYRKRGDRVLFLGIEDEDVGAMRVSDISVSLKMSSKRCRKVSNWLVKSNKLSEVVSALRIMQPDVDDTVPIKRKKKKKKKKKKKSIDVYSYNNDGPGGELSPAVRKAAKRSTRRRRRNRY